MYDMKHLNKKAVLLCVEIVSIIAVPLVIAAGAVFYSDKTALLCLIVVGLSLLLFFLGYEQGAPRLRDTMPVAVLAALAATGRILFAPIPEFKPMSAIAIIAGAALGRRNGFVVGALAALVSNFFFGQGPWTPWQMYAWGLIGYMGGVFAQLGLFKGIRPVLSAPSKRLRIQAIIGLIPLISWGVLSGYVYGLIINLWSIIGFYHPQTITQAAILYAAAIPFDTMHGIGTAVFLVALFGPWTRKIERIKRKYALME